MSRLAVEARIRGRFAHLFQEWLEVAVVGERILPTGEDEVCLSVAD